MKCVHCGDSGKAWKCPECRETIGAACEECHRELSHGRIAPAKGEIVRKPAKGKPATRPAPKRREPEPTEAETP